ncbi:MAG: AMP-binding protein, partial [Eubacterium sp.]|nr:AMP-binding protein [Eubacterium sp.]
TDYLAAYFTADTEVDIPTLREHAAKYLTAYMVPQAFLQLESMPMTANGKVDKRALPVIEITAEEIIAAENEVQEKILTIAKKVIGTDRIGVTTDLYMIGLSSIGCIKLCSLLSDAFEVTVKVAEIFECRTVRSIEALINDKMGEEGISYELRESYPLTQTQMGIYIDSELYAGTTVYNIPYLYKLDQRVDMEKLRRALQTTLLAHPYLFMTLRKEEGEVRAVRNLNIGPDTEPVLMISDQEPVKEELVRPFDLTSGERLFRVELFNTESGKYLFIDVHHIVCDGSSLTIFFKDLNMAYHGEKVPQEEFTGFEVALDEEHALKTDRPAAAQAWYDSIFLGCGGETLPQKDGKPTEERIGMIETLGTSSADRVRTFCAQNGLSLNAFFTAAFGLALQTYTASEQAVFSTIYNGRSDSRTARSISMFVKTLPVLYVADLQSTVIETVLNCQNYLISAMANDICSFARIKKNYGIGADISFAFQGEMEDTEETELCGYPVTVTDMALSQAKALLSVDIVLDRDTVRFIGEYLPSAYSEYTVKGLIRLVDQIIGEFICKDKVSEIGFLSEEDKEAIIHLHDTAAAVAERPAYRLLQDSTGKHPEKKALVAIDRTLTYRELNEEANAVGHVLRRFGAGPETIVAVLADRDSYAYVMREGVLKSGGAFMPVDPEYPEERIRYILDDSKAKLLITTEAVIERRRELLEALQSEGITIINVQDAITGGIRTVNETDTNSLKEGKAFGNTEPGNAAESLKGSKSSGDIGYVLPGDREDLNVEVPYDALAYVIYTSGSTGKPKGVMITNRNLVNFVDRNEKNLEVLACTEVAEVSVSIAAFTFDVSVMEQFVPFAHGMTNVLATWDQMMNAAEMCDLMVSNHVEFITCTPSYIMNMIEIPAFAPAVQGLKSIDVGSEPFPPVLFDKLKAINPELRIVNSYGPTECTVSCTLKKVVDPNDVTIGVPLANVTMATMDRNGYLQPLGAMGELVIMGSGVGRGYIGRKDLNERNFIRVLGMPAYRSGDLVRIREDGDIEFHGRMDDQ